MLKLPQRLRRIQVAENASAVMLEHFGRRRNIAFRRPFDRLYRAPDCRNQVRNFELFAWDEINDSIEKSGMAQLIAADSDILRAFLPRQIVLPRDAGKSARLNGVEHAIADAEQNVGGG